MESVEQIRGRLENIRSIEPILTALRTIALGTLQAALKRLGYVTLYHDQLLKVQRAALAHGLLPSAPPQHEIPVRRCALLIVGNQRGLCGPFTSAVVAESDRALSELRVADGEGGAADVDILVLGEHARREVHRRGLQPTWEGALPVTSVPSFDLAAELAATGLRRYEAGELDAFYATYNHYLGAGGYESRTVTLIPSSPPDDLERDESLWPPPIVVTDAHSLHHQVMAQLAALSVYRVLLSSSAAEQSARFQLMEGASQNSRRLIEELTLTYHTARQETITTQMLELAVSAGLVRPEQS